MIDLGIDATTALPGRTTEVELSGVHAITGATILRPFPNGWKSGIFALGCFWGAERAFWQLDGVETSAVGYIAGFTTNPEYKEVCSGRTGHTEAVLVGYDPAIISYDKLLQVFWESHDPTQGMRQGNDRGTQYRSGIYVEDDEELARAMASKAAYQENLLAAGHGTITTEIIVAPKFYYAEEYHQQYLHKNPQGYCGLGGTGVSCPIGLRA